MVISATASAVLAGAGGATPPGTNGKLAFVGPLETSYYGELVPTHLFTVNPNGKALTDLTPKILRRRIPIQIAWSPDGTRLAYAILEVPHEDRRVTLGVMNADGSGKHTLLEFTGRTPEWSTEIQEIAPIAWTRAGSEIAYAFKGPVSSQIAAVKPDGTDHRVVTSFTDADIVDFDWLPGDAQIALVAKFGSGVQSTWTIEPTGGSPTLVDPKKTYTVDVSPAGSRLAIVQDGGLATIGTDGTGRADVPGTRKVLGAAWSPDATRMAVRHDRWGGAPGVMRLDGTCAGQVAGLYAASISWQPLASGLPAGPVPCADVRAKVMKHRKYVQTGKTIRLSAEVTSKGPDPATAVVVKFSTGQALKAVSARASRGECALGRPVKCRLGTLPPGQRATVTVVARALFSGRDDQPVAEVLSSNDLDWLGSWSVGAWYTVCDRLGTVSRDVLTGTNRGDVLCGLGGDDVLRGLGGPDTIEGGDGNDTIYGGDGADNLYGDAGRDWVFGEGGMDRVEGGRGSDHVYGGPGFDDMPPNDDGAVDWIDGGPGGNWGYGYEAIDHVTRVDGPG